jgi:hypothetical protein
MPVLDGPARSNDTPAVGSSQWEGESKRKARHASLARTRTATAIYMRLPPWPAISSSVSVSPLLCYNKQPIEAPGNIDRLE